MQKEFIVLEERKKYILQQADDRWRAYKTRLRKKWLYHKSGRLRARPPDWKYPWLTQEIWNKFVAQSTSEKFKVLVYYPFTISGGISPPGLPTATPSFAPLYLLSDSTNISCSNIKPSTMLIQTKT